MTWCGCGEGGAEWGREEESGWDESGGHYGRAMMRDRERWVMRRGGEGKRGAEDEQRVDMYCSRARYASKVALLY